MVIDTMRFAGISMASDSTTAVPLKSKITTCAVVISVTAIALGSAATFALFSSHIKQTIPNISTVWPSLHAIALKTLFVCLLIAGAAGLIIRRVIATALNTLVKELETSQQELLTAQETYQIVAEFTAEVAFWREPGGNMKFISPNCLELTGYRDADFYADAEFQSEVSYSSIMGEYCPSNNISGYCSLENE